MPIALSNMVADIPTESAIAGSTPSCNCKHGIELLSCCSYANCVIPRLGEDSRNRAGRCSIRGSCCQIAAQSNKIVIVQDVIKI
jgi:hypothetical protein